MFNMTMTAVETLRLFAAGSLKAALSDVARAFERTCQASVAVEITFGASGLLREAIERGEPAHVFASADLGHPQRLVQHGLARSKVAVFARNRLCAIARAGIAVTSASLLDRLLDENIRVGTSTPGADPSGDYAFELFARAEQLKRGARVALANKALQLTGGPNSSKAPDGRNLYGWILTSGRADVFLTYRTNALRAKNEVPDLQIVELAGPLAVGAEYGLVVLRSAPAAAEALADFILADTGQAILASYGFARGG
jgi:ABC-type molybdate transport system substrate-binding protein